MHAREPLETHQFRGNSSSPSRSSWRQHRGFSSLVVSRTDIFDLVVARELSPTPPSIQGDRESPRVAKISLRRISFSIWFFLAEIVSEIR